jgi:hypothetical protein
VWPSTTQLYIRVKTFFLRYSRLNIFLCHVTSRSRRINYWKNTIQNLRLRRSWNRYSIKLKLFTINFITSMNYIVFISSKTVARLFCLGCGWSGVSSRRGGPRTLPWGQARARREFQHFSSVYLLFSSLFIVIYSMFSFHFRLQCSGSLDFLSSLMYLLESTFHTSWTCYRLRCAWFKYSVFRTSELVRDRMIVSNTVHEHVL